MLAGDQRLKQYICIGVATKMHQRFSGQHRRQERPAMHRTAQFAENHEQPGQSEAGPPSICGHRCPDQPEIAAEPLEQGHIHPVRGSPFDTLDQLMGWTLRIKKGA